jgi:DNA-binding transcriptional ArsR family regulator
VEIGAANIAAAIGEPARARMLYCLLDGPRPHQHGVGNHRGVSPSTASVHLARLKERRLVQVLRQGKHRYYSLQGESAARALEALIVAGLLLSAQELREFVERARFGNVRGRGLIVFAHTSTRTGRQEQARRI